MAKGISRFFKTTLLCLAFCVAHMAHAQEPATDTVLSDTSYFSTEENAADVEGEYVEPERPVTYNSAAPDAGQWQKATSDKAYSYKDAREYQASEKDDETDFSWLALLFLAIVRFIVSPLGQILLWGAFIAIIGYIAYRVLSGQGAWIFGKKDHKAEAEDAGAELTEEGLLEADWERLMNEALRAGNAREAIRYSYLRLLQLMQQRQLIAYRPDKTNIDYYRELADKPQRPAFRTVMRQYEWAWYGNIIPGKPEMDHYLQTFTQLKNSLGS